MSQNVSKSYRELHSLVPEIVTYCDLCRRRVLRRHQTGPKLLEAGEWTWQVISLVGLVALHSALDHSASISHRAPFRSCFLPFGLMPPWAGCSKVSRFPTIKVFFNSVETEWVPQAYFYRRQKCQAALDLLT